MYAWNFDVRIISHKWTGTVATTDPNINSQYFLLGCNLAYLFSSPFSSLLNTILGKVGDGAVRRVSMQRPNEHLKTLDSVMFFFDWARQSRSEHFFPNCFSPPKCIIYICILIILYLYYITVSLHSRYSRVLGSGRCLEPWVGKIRSRSTGPYRCWQNYLVQARWLDCVLFSEAEISVGKVVR